jgi:hypothetical protein
MNNYPIHSFIIPLLRDFRRLSELVLTLHAKHLTLGGSKIIDQNHPDILFDHSIANEDKLGTQMSAADSIITPSFTKTIINRLNASEKQLTLYIQLKNTEEARHALSALHRIVSLEVCLGIFILSASIAYPKKQWLEISGGTSIAHLMDSFLNYPYEYDSYYRTLGMHIFGLRDIAIAQHEVDRYNVYTLFSECSRYALEGNEFRDGQILYSKTLSKNFRIRKASCSISPRDEHHNPFGLIVLSQEEKHTLFNLKNFHLSGVAENYSGNFDTSSNLKTQ